MDVAKGRLEVRITPERWRRILCDGCAVVLYPRSKTLATFKCLSLTAPNTAMPILGTAALSRFPDSLAVVIPVLTSGSLLKL